MTVRVCRECPHRRCGHPYCAVRVPASSATGDNTETALHPAERIALGPADGELAQVIGDRWQPEHAWPALLRSLAR
jgi:hypothetical protein